MKKIVLIVVALVVFNLSAMECSKSPSEFDEPVQQKIQELINLCVTTGRSLPNAQENRALPLFEEIQKKIDFNDVSSLDVYHDLVSKIDINFDYVRYLGFAADATKRLKNNKKSERLRSLAIGQWDLFRLNAQYLAQEKIFKNNGIKFPRQFNEDKTEKAINRFLQEWFEINKNISKTMRPVLFGCLLYFGHLYQVEVDTRKEIE